ncbi:1-deoxy-D-xylulose-5-phosphate synthase [Candidatus Avelusimicrobium gallicola]|uniref:1-deoxy-D-xylulose-5-phosphate synthase n=1 Tax=Candidatus Avelusimicrobium gallicola TaxID=2562704 RepID=A0A1Y4DBP0_9BACT|nr:1-deoxy-D-xylulose-5-phosphate synthase [Elusimicrobium sp. An273]OUO56573.1 1-deoxy-D-xylulose-5-phosphate synthase [Elusimicrobium sp. An273]
MKVLPSIQSPKDLRLIKKELLPTLCEELRSVIIDTASKNGGHLGSSLGAVEIITALHYVFNTPEDKIVFDTGHQAYAHKLLTGRQKEFHTIRTQKGLSGFPKRCESPYDTFGVGHASTAISAALGMAIARDQKKEKNKVIAVVGDGCLTGGMAYEAMQNAGLLRSDLLVILNDNQMFISKRVGALGKALTKLLTTKYVQLAEEKASNFLKRFDELGNNAAKLAKRARSILFPGTLFEEMGFRYFGPVNGNDINEMIEVLESVKDVKGPVMLHVVTKKGKGYKPAEEKPTKFHGVGVFDVDTGDTIGKSNCITFTQAFSNTLVKLAEKDPSITAITAAMPEGTGLDAFRDKFPSRYFDVGIAEEHAATFAAGLAAGGMKPVVAIYSTFIQRCYDQIIHDVALQKLPVVFALDRAGLVGEDGPTHHGVFDLSFLREVPNLIVAAPADENELQHLLKTALDAKAPFVLRYPRGSGFGVEMDAAPKRLEIGKGVWLKKGKDLNILAIGNRVHPAMQAAALLAEKDIDCGVANMRFVHPLDTHLIDEALKLSRRIVTVEDNMLAGGFGSAVAEYVSDKQADFKLLRLGIGDEFVEHGKVAQLYDQLGLNAEEMTKHILKWKNK